MRHLFAFVFLVLHLQPAAVEAQSLSSLYLTQQSDGTFRLTVNSMFFAGDGQIHIQESAGHDTTYQNDTLKFRLFYPAVVGFTFTDYVDTFNLGYIAPNSVSTFTLYRFSAHEVSPNVWDTTAFSEPYADTSLLFPWVTSVSAAGGQPQFNVYPNPVIAETYVFAGSDYAGKCVVEILDVCKRVLFRESYFAATTPIKLDLGSYSSGVYILSITDKDNRRKTTRVYKK